MKKFFKIILAVFMVIGLMGITDSYLPDPNESMAAEQGPVLAMGTPIVKMSKKSKVVIMGTGFEPGQKIRILLVTPDGQRSDVSYAVKPEPKVDKTGSWTTTWSAGRYVAKKLIKGGVYTIMAVGSDYIPIAHTPVVFQKTGKSKKK